MNYGKFHTEHVAWLAKYFPNQPALEPLLGVIEELGELARALLKQRQTARYGSDKRYVGRDWDAEIKDALGDAVIFLSSLCVSANMMLQHLVRRQELLRVDPTIALGSAGCYFNLVLKECAGCLRVDALANGYYQLRCLAHSLGYDLDQLTEETWAKVKERQRATTAD